MIDDLELARTLLEGGIADRGQLRQARQLQLLEETSLYMALIEHDILNEHVLVELVANKLNLPFVSLQEREVPEKIKRLVPVELARTYGVVPLDLRSDANGDLLLLAMKDPLDIMAMDDISTQVNVGIQPVLCGPRDLGHAVERLYVEKKPERVSFDLPRNNSVDFGAFSQHSPEPEFESPGFDEPAFEEPVQEEVGTEDSWAVFFDDALSSPDPSSGMEMRDRASTMALDLMDVEEVLDVNEDDPHSESLGFLDSPGEPSSMHDEDGLAGWDVDSALNPKPNIPPPPPQKAKEIEKSQDSFAALYAAIDSDEAASIPDGTFIASPSISVTGELDADEIQRSLYEADEEDFPPPADEGDEGLVMRGMLNASSVAEMIEQEVEISDEAGSSTQMGNLGQMLSVAHHQESVIDRPGGNQLTINDQRSFTTLGSPRRLNPDGSVRPQLVIEESEGEDLFASAIAHVDAAESGQFPISRDEPEESAPVEEPVVQQEEKEVPAPSAALGRLKLKKIAVKPQSSLLDAPIVEKSSGRKSEPRAESVPIKPRPEPEEVEPSEAESHNIEDILASDDILAGFASALDDPPTKKEVLVDTSEGDADASKLIDATREFDVESVFGFGDEGSLEEATNAALGEAHARIERLNKMIRNANNNAAAHVSEEPYERQTRPTQDNKALTHESVQKMRQSTMDLSTDLLLQTGDGLPDAVDDSRLLRAALLILISKDLIKMDELIALAKSLPESV